MSYSGEAQKVIEDSTMQIDKLMFIIDGANDAIADICTAAKEKCEVKPAELRKIAKAYHNNNVDEERDKINDIYDMAEKILKKT